MQNDIFFAKYLHISKTFCNFVAKLSFLHSKNQHLFDL